MLSLYGDHVCLLNKSIELILSSKDQISDIVTLVDNASKDLFGKTMAPHHCVHSILPLQTEKKHDLRTRGHNYPLPQYKYNLHGISFLVRSLFEYV